MKRFESDLNELDDVTQAALREYARNVGPKWKRELVMKDFPRAGSRHVKEWAPLQRLRNWKGPGWVNSLPDDIGQLRPVAPL